MVGDCGRLQSRRPTYTTTAFSTPPLRSRIFFGQIGKDDGGGGAERGRFLVSRLVWCEVRARCEVRTDGCFLKNGVFFPLQKRTPRQIRSCLPREPRQ